MAIPPLLSAEALAEYLANPQDARVAAVTEWIRGRCGWHIAPTITETVTVDGTDTRVLAMPSLHITAVDTVTESGTAVDVEWSTVGLLRHPNRWTDRWRSVTVTYTHGYPSVPADLAKVVIEAALRLPEPGAGAVKKVGPFEMASTAVFLPEELETIDRYRILPGPA